MLLSPSLLIIILIIIIIIIIIIITHDKIKVMLNESVTGSLNIVRRMLNNL